MCYYLKPTEETFSKSKESRTGRRQDQDEGYSRDRLPSRTGTVSGEKGSSCQNADGTNGAKHRQQRLLDRNINCEKVENGQSECYKGKTVIKVDGGSGDTTYDRL